MTFHIGFVHDIESEVVEHCVHLRLARVVACAHSVYIGLLHHAHIGEHCLHIYGAAVFGMCVLIVHTFEEYTLSVDIHEIAAACDVTETVFCREHHLLSSVGVVLAYDDSVEIRFLGVPRCEACELICRERDALSLVSLGQFNILSHACYRRAVGVEQFHLNVLLCCLAVTVVDGQSYVHCRTGGLGVHVG